MKITESILKRGRLLTTATRDYTSVLLGTGTGRIFSFLAAVVLARRLGSAEFGKFSLCFVIMMLLGQLPSAIDDSFIKFTSVSTTNKVEYRKFILANLLLKTFFFFVIVVIGLLLSEFLAWKVFRKESLSFPLLLSFLGGASYGFYSSLLSHYQAKKRFGRYALLSGFYGLSIFVTIVLFNLIFKTSAFSNLAAYVAIIALFGSFSIVLLRKSCGETHWLDLKTEVLKLFHFGKWLVVATVAYIIFERADLIIVSRFVGYAEIGQYAVAVRMSMIPSLLTAAAFIIFLPRGSDRETWTDSQKRKKYFWDSTTVIIGITIFVVFLTFFSPRVINLLFGSQFMASIRPAKVLILSRIFVAIYMPLSFTFYAFNKPQWIVLSTSVRLLTILVAGILMIPQFGVMGASYAVFLAHTASFLIIVFLAARILTRLKNIKIGSIMSVNKRPMRDPQTKGNLDGH